MNEPDWPLVGRERELDLLERLLDESRAGKPRFVCVTGEPGIGKTSLMAEILRRAEDRGCLTLQGSAAEFEQELPFGLVVDALDEYLQSLDPRAFSRLASEDVGELAGVFPAFRSLGPASKRPGSAADRFLAHHAVRELIERLAASQPLVLVLDDLQWADGASLELAAHLLRRLPNAPVLLATTCRTGQTDRMLLATIEAAAREGGVEQIELGPLTPADAETLFDGETAAGSRRLHEASGGNPFYMLQLARMGEDGGNGSSLVRDHAGVPAAVSAAIVGELDSVSKEARALVDAAAVAGDPFELDLAVATAAMEEPDALVALDELMDRDLVRSDVVPRRFRFRHPLVRSAVYESCPVGARLAAHGRSAEALAALGAPATARAHHVEQSARRGDAAAIAVLREAGQATARRVPQSAARWFEVALHLLPGGAPAEERVELLMALAGAKAATGRFEEGRAALLESIELTPRDRQVMRVSLIGACASVEQLLGHHREAHARLRTAVDELPEDSARQTAELMLYMATGDFYRQDYEAMRDSAERALAAAQELGEVPLIAASTAALSAAWIFAGVVPEAEAQRAKAAALVDAMSDEELAVRLDALANLCAAELYLDLYPPAGDHARRGLAVAHATGQAEISPFLIPVLGSVLQLEGHLADAEQVLEEAVEAARLSGNVQALAWNLLNRANAALSVGDIENGLSVGQESVDITRGLDDSLVSSYASANFSFVLCEAGEYERAIETVTSGAGGEELPLIPGGWRANYFELIARSRVALGQPAEAKQAADRAAAVAERVGTHLSKAMAHRAAAIVALQDDPETAAERALESAAEADAIGARVEGALARTLAGRAFAAAGDRDRAVAELETSAKQLDTYGAMRYRSQAERELRRLGRRIHRRTAPGKADGSILETLTEREAEIARLVVDRRTNPQIAQELFLSVKTIETHMRNLFLKLGVSSRVEVARVMERDERPSG